jgi:hypothetical protein
MSRLFDGQSSTECVTFSVGNAPPDEGPITLAALVRPQAAFSATTCYIMTGKDAGGTEIWALLTDTAKTYITNDLGSGGPTLTASTWYWVVVTKATGSVIPRWHIKDITNGTSWVHQNDTSNVADGTGPITSILVGNLTAAGTVDFCGEIVALSAWASAMSDLQVEAACTLAATDLVAASPSWATLWNQASTATAVADITGGGGNQTAISGTSVSASEPPGWSYSLGGPAPVFQTAGTYGQTAGGNPATTIGCGVPTGVAALDIIELHLYIGDPTVSVTIPPTGFVELVNSPVLIAGNQSQRTFWKRATGADSGTYTTTFSASTFAEAVAIRVSGCVTTGTPYDVVTSATDSANSTVTPAVSVTTTGANRLLTFKGTNWTGGTWSAGSGFTVRAQGGFGLMGVQTATQATAGSSGSVTETCTGSDKRTAWLGALLPAGISAAAPAGRPYMVRQAVNRSYTY